MSKKKETSSVLSKILIPIFILGLCTILGNIGMMRAIIHNQQESKRISGTGMEVIKSLDELYLSYEKVQKNVLIFCLEENPQIREVAKYELKEQKKSIQEAKDILENHKENFSEHGQTLITETFEMAEKLQSDVYTILARARTDQKKAYEMFQKYLSKWSDGIKKNIDLLNEENNTMIEEAKKNEKKTEQQSRILSISIIVITILTFIVAIVVLIELIVKPLKRQKAELTKIIEDINQKQGDLTKRLTVKGKDEISACAQGVNTFLKTLQGIMSSIIQQSDAIENIVSVSSASVGVANENARDISAITEELSATMEEVSATTNHVGQNVEETEKRVQKMDDKTKQIAEYTSKMKEHAITLEKNARNNMSNTQKMIGSITEEMEAALEKSKSVAKIGELTEEILSIAGQTNLLALNASIEAARAGDAGKGFAVVAEEIRLLADSSRDTANNIQNINQMVSSVVNELVQQIMKMERYMNETILTDYQTFAEGGKQYSDDAQRIYQSINEAAEDVTEILRNVTEITQAIQGISHAVDESASGVSDAAMSMDALVMSVAEVNAQLQENEAIAKKLKLEEESFTRV